MKWWERKKRRGAAPVVQVRQGEGHPFGVLDRYTPLGTGEVALYRAIRDGVPLLDAAIWKLVRLCGGVKVIAEDKAAQAGLEEFFQKVNIGWGQRGIQAFLDRYLDDLFTCGHALGEIVLTGDGRDIAAVLCADPEQVEAKRGDNPLDFKLCLRQAGSRKSCPGRSCCCLPPFSPRGTVPAGCLCCGLCPFWRAFC